MKKIAFFLLLIPLFIGCQKGAQTKLEKRVANFSFLSPIRSLDPRISNEYPSCLVVNMVYEGLMHLDLDGNPTFGIAESVDISEDQLTYTFTLRESKWSNGDPVTAYDFEYAWKKAVDPEYAQTGAYTFYTIKNVSACLEKKISVDNVGVKALNERTLQVELEHPAPYFLSLTTCPTYSPINKRVDQEHPNWCNEVKAGLVCNGPFKVTKWKKGVEIFLDKNDSYWDADSVRLPGIHIQIIPDASTQFYLFEKGELDWVGQPCNPLPFDIIKDKNVIDQIETKEMVGLNWLFINTETPPFNNKNIRKAFACAINRKAITDHVYQLGEVPALKILNSELSLQQGPYFDDGNIQKAREYLEVGLRELGLEKKDLKPIVFSQRASIFYLRVTQAIQQQIKEALGLSIEIEQSDFPVHFNKLAKGDFSIGEMAWISWLKDPIYMLDTFRSRSFATNMSRWEDERYQAYLEKSDHEINPDKRKKYLHEAEQLLMEEMPVIPVSFITLTFMRNPQLKNVYVSPLKELDLRYAYFDLSEE